MLLNAGKSNTHGLGLIISFGLIYFVIYYLVFTILVRKLNLATPGREPEEIDASRGTAEITGPPGP
jgi:PTS system N-acetylglucosamine-specific IIC component